MPPFCSKMAKVRRCSQILAVQFVLPTVIYRYSYAKHENDFRHERDSVHGTCMKQRNPTVHYLLLLSLLVFIFQLQSQYGSTQNASRNSQSTD